MTNFTLNFTNPWLLMLLIPAIGVAFVPFFLVKKKYRRNRNRIASLVLHCAAIFIAVFLLAGVTYSYDLPNKENELILLVDCSDSGGSSQADKDEFIQTVVNLCGDDYKLGIVKFGYNQLYAAELSNDSDEVYRRYLNSADPDTSATDVASALKYASALFKRPALGKIVLLSDGVETDGTAMSVIKSIAAEGIKVDTAYFPNEEHDEVQIASVKLPEYKINVGDDFKVGLSLNSNFGFEDVDAPDVQRNAVEITIYDNDVPSAPFIYMLKKGEQTVELTHKFDLPGMHKLRFEISCGADVLTKNNSYHTYVKLDDLNNILLIERRSGESQTLQALLADSYGMNVTALGVDTDFSSIPKTVKELCQYEQVILVNIANSDLPAGFDEILYKYVNQFGGGLFTVGGENDEIDGKLVNHAYNSDDLANTLLADMLPVQAIDYTPPVAVMIVIDCSGSMSMGKFEQAQKGAIACLGALSSRDYCGVMSFDTEAGAKLSVLPMSRKDDIIKAINEVDKHGDAEGGSGGTVFSTAIDNAGRALAAARVERRHIIIVTDGNPTDTIKEYGPHIDNNVKSGITMSIVGIRMDTGLVQNMEETCKRGGGKFYNVPDREIENLPTIMYEDMTTEAIKGINYGEEFVPTINHHTSVVACIAQEDMPPLTGYYGTKIKDDKSIVVPLMGKFVPIYAQWKFGEGTVGSFMSDLDGIWSEKFLSDIVGQTIIGNIVKNLFPSQALKTDEINAVVRHDNYSVQASVDAQLQEGQTVSVSVKPMSREAVDFYVDPIPVHVADGYSRFNFAATCPGVYEIKIDKKDADGNVLATLTLYHTLPYSREYDYFPTKELIGEKYMESLAEDGRGIAVEYAIDIFDTFEKTIHKDVDPRIALLIVVIVLFLLDIAARKFKFKLPHELIREYKQKKAEKAKR